jgi:hypothetical protein
MSRPWTEEEYALALEMLARDDDDAAFLAQFGKTKNSVESRRDRLKYFGAPRKPRGSPWTAEKDAQALALKAKGHTPQEIADAVGKTRGATRFRLRQLSLTAEQREAESRARHANSVPRERQTARHHVTQAHSKFVPPEVLEEAARRSLAPQPPFGVPPVGYSALDRRKNAGAST